MASRLSSLYKAHRALSTRRLFCPTALNPYQPHFKLSRTKRFVSLSSISVLSSISQHPSTRYPQVARNLCTSHSDSVAKTSSIQKATGSELVLSPPALVVTREYEWANILIGFEQANKYTIRAAPGGEVVGYIAEEGSFGSAITRNVLRTHRPFKATVFDKDRNVIFRIRRPMYLVSTSIFVETEDGEVLGEVHMNWHMWRRRYNLYIDKKQFAEVDSGFLAVDFDMRDVEGKRIASVNKDFTGFAREIFTDARQYVLRLDPSFGLDHDGSLVYDAATVNVSPEESSAMQMTHRERAVILAAAISIDFDYFSLHSRGPGAGMLMAPPIPVPGPAPPASVPGAGPAADAGVNAGAAVGADMMSEGMQGPPPNAETPYQIDDADIDSAPAEDSSQAGAWGGTEPLEEQQFDSAQPSGNAQESEWATFEEPDHGFDDPYADDDAWTSDSDSWGGDDVGGDGDGGGGILGLIKGIFFGDD